MIEIFFVKNYRGITLKQIRKRQFKINLRSLDYCQYNGIEQEQPVNEVKKSPKLSLKLGSKIRTCQPQRKITVSYEKTA